MTMATLEASDGFAIAMITMILLAFGMLASLGFCMRANAARRDHQVDELLEEISDEEQRRKQVPAEEAPPAEAWERDGDWWKS